MAWTVSSLLGSMIAQARTPTCHSPLPGGKSSLARQTCRTVAGRRILLVSQHTHDAWTARRGRLIRPAFDAETTKTRNLLWRHGRKTARREGNMTAPGEGAANPQYPMVTHWRNRHPREKIAGATLQTRAICRRVGSANSTAHTRLVEHFCEMEAAALLEPSRALLRHGG